MFKVIFISAGYYFCNFYNNKRQLLFSKSHIFKKKYYKKRFYCTSLEKFPVCKIQLKYE